MIIDLDAHQGNGHERDFMKDLDVYIVDAYNPYIYPNDHEAEKAIKTSIHITPGMSDKHYLTLLKNQIADAFLTFMP